MEVLCFVILSLLGGLAGLALFIYFLKKGQFEDPEEPKYQMFRQEEDAEIQK
jgi:cbb3-type cytochrome oxidase maturation protein